jgi:Zn-dependent protease with chaperone function
MGKQSGGGQTQKWLSTHPSHEARINDLRVFEEKVAPLYAAAKGGAAAGR